MSLYNWKEGTASQNENFLIPRHSNAKKPTVAAYYRTMLSENCSSSSIYNEVNHEAKYSVCEKIRDPKQLSNLKQNLNKTKRNQVATVKKLIELLKQ